MSEAIDRGRWKYAVLPVLFMIVVSIYPQVNLFVARGGQTGTYFVSNYDEPAYSAYINSLINGRPRKNDPFLGTDTEHETLYSIQFIPAYLIAAPSRLFGVSASTAFIVLILLCAAASSLAIYRFLDVVTEDGLLASAGMLTVLCFGTLAAFQGELRQWIDGRVLVDFFPFLRRYQPGIAFPLFFVFCTMTWRSITAESRRGAVLNGALAGIMFAVLVFSYFYLWTAAAAWVGVFMGLFFLFRPQARTNTLITAGIVAGVGATALIPYFSMIANRSPNLDSVQLLSMSRAPIFASPTLIIGLLTAGAVILAVRRGLTEIDDGRTLLAISFAVSPVILFNQQIITGRSLQPAHYEIFIANYSVMIAIMVLTSIVIRSRAKLGGELPLRRPLIYLAVIAAAWGMVEAAGSTSRSAEFAAVREESMPAMRYIDELEQIRPGGETPGVVLATNFVTADLIPTVTTARPLWNPHISSAGGVSVAENKRLFYLYLYYSGYSGKDLEDALRANSFEVTAAIFGSERALPELAENSKAVGAQEIAGEVRMYSEFAQSMDHKNAIEPTLSYIVVVNESGPPLANLDRWYSRDEGRAFGLFKVYRLSLKP